MPCYRVRSLCNRFEILQLGRFSEQRLKCGLERGRQERLTCLLLTPAVRIPPGYPGKSPSTPNATTLDGSRAIIVLAVVRRFGEQLQNLDQQNQAEEALRRGRFVLTPWTWISSPTSTGRRMLFARLSVYSLTHQREHHHEYTAPTQIAVGPGSTVP